MEFGSGLAWQRRGLKSLWKAKGFMLKFPADHVKGKLLNRDVWLSKKKVDCMWMFSCLWRGRRCLIEVVVSL